MSERVKPLNAIKCVECRLWYTFSVVITHLNNSCSAELEELIKSIISKDDNSSKWISHAILWKLFNDKFSNNPENMQTMLANIQLSNAFKLTYNIPDQICQDPLKLFNFDINNCYEYIGVLDEKTKENITFLKRNAQENPWLLCWILNELSFMRLNNSCDARCTVQDIYTFIMKHLLKRCSDSQSKDTGEILCVLSKSLAIHRDAYLTWIFPELIKICDIVDLELAIYCREDTELLKTWNFFLDQIYARLESADNVGSISKINNAVFTISNGPVINLNKKELLQRIVRNKSHWLLDILDSCCTLIMNNKYNDVAAIMTTELCQGLCSTLLFYILHKHSQEKINNINACEENRNICKSLDYIFENFQLNTWNNPTLNNLGIILKKCMKVVNWIFDKSNYNRKEKTSNDHSHSILKEKAFKPLSTLVQDYDVLSVLKETISLHDTDIVDIDDLLKEFPKCEETYLAYYCVLLALKAIMSCENNSSEEAVIKNYFIDMEFYLNTLRPISLRLNTIEDIFCLLFLRYDDFDVEEADCDNLRSSDFLKQFYTGFVCNTYAVTKILYHLNNAVTTIHDMSLDDQDQIALSRIKKILADANWRLKLCTETLLNSDIDSTQDDQSTNNKTIIMVDSQVNFPHYIKNNSHFYKRSEDVTDEPKIKSDSSSDTMFAQNNGKSRDRSKNLPWINDPSTLKTINQKQVINIMLSSKESLVLQCMWRSNYGKAQEIIEMSEMTNTQLDGEVRFTNAFQQFRRNMSKEIHSLNVASTMKEQSKCSMLDNIRLAAQEGIQSSRHANQFETFLASQETRLRTIIADSVQNTQILTLSALDLALTVDKTHQASCSLCDIAVKYLKLCSSLENSEHMRFFSIVHQLIHENKEETSAMNILCDAKVSLCSKEWKEKSEFWSALANKYKEFAKSRRMKITIDLEIDDITQCHQLQALRRITTFFGTDKKYLQDVNSHLQLLQTVFPNNFDIPCTDIASALLKIPLHFYFGYQIFDLNIEPAKLEPIACNLRVNLVHSILTNICPEITCNAFSQQFINQETSGYIVLNKSAKEMETEDYSIKNPNEFIETLLNELITVLRTLNAGHYTVSYILLNDIAEHPSIRAVLNKTSHLANLDLSELSICEEIVTFFINIWNVMFLHTLLCIWSKNPPFNDLKYSVSLMSIGYIIGDLGFVTLSALRSKLLGDLISSSNYFTRVDELNEPAWQDFEPMQDPRVIFAMANEFRGTPRIQVYRATTLTKDLNEAAREYLDYYTRKSTPNESKRNLSNQAPVVLPDFVKEYQRIVRQSTKDHGFIADDDNLFSVDDYFDVSQHVARENVKYVKPDYSYEVILEYFDHVDLNPQKKDEESSMYRALCRERPISHDLLRYLDAHCWILSYFAQRMSCGDLNIFDDIYDKSQRTIYFENFLNSPWIKRLQPFFENNKTLVGIHDIIPEERLWVYLRNSIKNREWNNVLNAINALSDSTQIFEIQSLKDQLIRQLILNTEFSDAKLLKYLYQIKSVHVLAQTVIYGVDKWHVNVCENALLHVLHHENSNVLPSHCKEQMNQVLHRVKIFHKMLPYCANECDGTWYDVVYCTQKIDSLRIINSLLNADMYELCLEWLECQSSPLETQPCITQDFLIGLLKNEKDHFKHASKLLQLLPSNQSIKICKGIIKKLDSINALYFVGNYLLQHCKETETVKYKKLIVGIEILKNLDYQERSLYLHLVRDPLLILEQLLMNCKFECLQKVLDTLSDKMQEADVSLTKFDETIKFYAEKSLDFRISLQRDGTDGKMKNVQSLHSLHASETGSTEFLMPVTAPTKEEWVPNDKVRQCSCCKSTIFSMFNRRHHCRRCGRIICAVCSQHRMQVAGYPSSVLVRVCDDCKRQTALQMRAAQDTPSTPSNETFDCWRLTKDKTLNQCIKEEFSFEYAPSVSLCLSILNLHSNHKKYTSFLLDRCHEMKRLLQPVSGGRINPEVDHAVIIKMIKSLLVAVKVKCAKLGFNTGLTHCDRFLSQIDLIATLAKSDCLALLPPDDLEEHTLRKLRDLLAEKEQWTLALDVSTKAGLDTQGVWAAWGKACLKVGCFELARDKFSHCLDKISSEEFDDFVILSHPKDEDDQSDETNETLSLKKYEIVKSRPTKNSPLLSEILQILENISVNGHFKQQSANRRSKAANEILNALNSLKPMCQGHFTVKQIQLPKVQNIYYEESLYYLLTYGCYSSILEFYIKHEEFVECLNYVLENNIEPELFFNSVYLCSLKNGDAEKLHEAMRASDPSLFTWKKYLMFICHSLERKQYLHVLYELQLFMKDYIRASMTCIRFYLNDSNTYTVLCSKQHLLYDAQKHLESELQFETLGKKRRKSTSSISSNQSGLLMEMEPSEIDKHINTISRQMEVTKFLKNAESEGRDPYPFLTLFPNFDCDSILAAELPTLFGNQQQKTHLAVLAILCGRDIEEGFGIAFRILQDYNLSSQKVYSLASHVLAVQQNVPAIEQLIKCCRSSGAPNSLVISDHVLTHCVKLLLDQTHHTSEQSVKNQIDTLIRLITDIELKISAYIDSKQLKAAYLLAVKYSRTQDIRKILKESDRLGQNAIKAICTKWLQQHSK